MKGDGTPFLSQSLGVKTTPISHEPRGEDF